MGVTSVGELERADGQRVERYRRVGRPRHGWVVVGVVLAFAVESALILRSTGGHFTYTLDDPYIHLALADQIRHGHYGINPTETSSPASSILWPFLLSLTAGLRFQDWVPLLWNLIFTAGSALLLHGVFARYVKGWVLVGATVAAVLALDLVGIAFSGLEHPLQIFLALLVGRGVVELASSGRVDPLLLVAMAVGPLVRYENAAFSVAAALVLVARGHVRQAAAATAAWVAGVGAFTLFLVTRGLEPLPSSVLVKMGIPGASRVDQVVWRLELLLVHPQFLLCGVIVVIDAVVLRRWTVLHWFAAVTLVAHAVAGGFTQSGRYEVYLLAGLVPVLARMAADWGFVRSGPLTLLVSMLGVALALSAIPLALWSFAVPSASADIESQQAQTARFVAGYWREPIAVNDLGLVAYRGGQRVLDLGGLASQDARHAQATSRHWLGPLVRHSGVRAAAIYTGWFRDQIPASWVTVGTLSGRPAVTSSGQTVTVFATDRRAVPDLCRALRRFAVSGTVARVELAPACPR